MIPQPFGRRADQVRRLRSLPELEEQQTLAQTNRLVLVFAPRAMQVKCWKCGQLIALSDVIESSGGRLSHVECALPRTMTADERQMLFVYCSDHVVAQCLSCGLGFRMMELAAPNRSAVAVPTSALDVARTSPRTSARTSMGARSFQPKCGCERRRCGRRRSAS